MLRMKRNSSIDILRTIGILLILLAHTNCPFVIRQLRIFDVVLLVIVSGYVFKNPINLFNYIVKRFNRLVLPTWIFLALFFSGVYLIKNLLNINLKTIEVFSLKSIIESFLLYKGIGFVWIMGVYFFISIVGPLILKKITFYRLLIYFCMIEIIVEILMYYNYKVPIIFDYIIYTLIFCYGVLLKNDKIPLKNINMIIIAIIIFWILSTKNYNIGLFKYPPRSIYICYGIICSNILIFIKDKILNKINILVKISKYIGKSTMWFYLFHIIGYYLLLILESVVKISWIMEYIILISIALILLIIKDILLNLLYNKFSLKQKKYLNIFEG